MQEGSLAVTDKMPDNIKEHIINLRITHRRTSVPELESCTFKDPEKTLTDINAIEGVRECLLLQTCNRIEIYAVISEQEADRARAKIVKYWQQNTVLHQADFHRFFEEASGSDALLHLFRLTSGLESMIVGEDQILGQIQDAFDKSREIGTVGPILLEVFDRGIRAGKAIRSKTRINKGSVSIGSVAVGLVEEAVGNLENKKVAIIGAGEIGALVGKSLARRKTSTIFVTNRTFERAVLLSKILGAQAVKFDRIEDLLASVDVVIAATSAPHYVIRRNMVTAAMERRKNSRLLIFDLAQPRNVDATVGEVAHVELRNIDNLRVIAHNNLENRLNEAENAEAIIKEEITRLELRLKRQKIEPIISAICSKADIIRRREVAKAFKRMDHAITLKNLPKQQYEHLMRIVEDLSCELVERVLSDPISSIRKAAINGDNNRITLAQNIFGTKPADRGEE